MSNLENLSEEQTAAADAPASEDTSFADILSQFEQDHHEPAPGENLNGTVVTVTPEAVIVDIGGKMEGIIPVQSMRDAGREELPEPGEQITVSVSGRSPEGYYELSMLKAERPKDWSGLQAAFDEKRTIAGVVTDTVKGGLRVDIGVRAFMPASRSGVREIADLEKLVGQEIQCRITKLDVSKEDVVVDRRVVLEEEEKRSKETFFASLHEGQVLTGTVRSLMEYGAFVDIGGVDGLLHVADISWARIGKPADVLQVGERVEVKILKINRETRKISLGMKQLQADPWSIAAEKYKPGQRVSGTVARLTDFGAFIALEPGIDGLVHVSEMSWSKKIRKPSDLLRIGEQVEVAVLGVNAAEHRISLGLKQALGDPWDTVQEKFPVGSVVEGTITNMANFGAFVDLGDGIEGLIHVGDITRDKRLDHPKDVLKNGEKVRAAVLEIDRDRRRIRLGLKQLEPTSTDNYIAEHNVGDTVTGRVVEVRQDRAKIDLGEGVFATCRLPDVEAESREDAERAPTGIEELTARLAARWKQGASETAAASKGNQIKPGQ
ncbi:MAG TPA: 30S ribosomal protein S1, partial [Bryobacteraceae bacterium]|nr:30S ribosomal protein S1 [Bryobacteraceae bacterium]